MGGNLLRMNLKHFLSKHGIQYQNTVPYTPQQNRVAERKNRMLVEMARCMLYSKGPKKIWAEAVSCANFILNRVPTKVVNHVTPGEKCNG